MVYVGYFRQDPLNTVCLFVVLNCVMYVQPITTSLVL